VLLLVLLLLVVVFVLWVLRRARVSSAREESVVSVCSRLAACVAAGCVVLVLVLVFAVVVAVDVAACGGGGGGGALSGCRRARALPNLLVLLRLLLGHRRRALVPARRPRLHLLRGHGEQIGRAILSCRDSDTGTNPQRLNKFNKFKYQLNSTHSRYQQL
jgi:hypothetical protein